jgi:hypothetical protein
LLRIEELATVGKKFHVHLPVFAAWLLAIRRFRASGLLHQATTSCLVENVENAIAVAFFFVSNLTAEQLGTTGTTVIKEVRIPCGSCSM